MTVQQLIDELSKIEDKTLEVRMSYDYRFDSPEVNSVEIRKYGTGSTVELCADLTLPYRTINV